MSKSYIFHCIFRLSFPIAKEFKMEEKERKAKGYFQDGIGILALYKNGKQQGSVWLGTITKGMLYGTLDQHYEFTGNYGCMI